MPKISQRLHFDGANERIARLGLLPLWTELEEILTNFDLLIEQRKNSNGAAAIRSLLDSRFKATGGWQNKASGGVDWTKCHSISGASVCLGVEIQFSGRSDLLIVDVAHLREEITSGKIDVGVIVVPSDQLALFLTDRVARFSDAERAVQRARAEDLPLSIIALEHDGEGPSLAKQRTRQGRLPPGSDKI